MSFFERVGNTLGAMLAKKAMLQNPRWLDIALSQLDVAEIPGLSHNDAIIAYHATTTLKSISDETAWCSSFVNWCMSKAGIKGTNSATARSWLKWGTETKPKVGAVAVLSRGANPSNGHVGFYLGEGRRGRIILLGGNQGNKVSKQEFPANQVLGYRWPKGDA